MTGLREQIFLGGEGSRGGSSGRGAGMGGHGSFARTFCSARISEIIAKLSQKYHFYLIISVVPRNKVHTVYQGINVPYPVVYLLRTTIKYYEDFQNISHKMFGAGREFPSSP